MSKKEKDWAKRIYHKLHLDGVPPRIRKIIVGIIGGTVLLIGVMLIFLPGPAFVVIPVGLAILATEFYWARLWMNKIRALPAKVRKLKKKISH